MPGKLDFATLRDKVMGCWLGKTIGGTLGAPMEGQRRIHDVTFYTQDLSGGPPPNDDLDLQLVWLDAVEKHGRAVNASILGEYWLSCITPNWVEYGTAKRNLAMGFAPPLSGVVDNVYRDSCGCFIRSELWACLAPGFPENAAHYAYEDGCVDHAGEGLIAEVFCAALQSAAFVESDPETLLAIGLSYIPGECAVRKAVDAVVAARREGVDWKEARRRVRMAAPGSFGLQHGRLRDRSQEPADGTPDGAPGFDAPENVAYAVLGWLYGDGDFGRALCLAVNCGEDTDCSAATLGALLGILSGAEALPSRWIEPLGDRIVTGCINANDGTVWIPRTFEELTTRTLRQIPVMLGTMADTLEPGAGFSVWKQERGDLYSQTPGAQLFPKGLYCDRRRPRLKTREKLGGSPYRVFRHFDAFDALLDYGADVHFTPDAPRRLRLELWHNWIFQQQFWIEARLELPPGVRPVNGAVRLLPLQYTSGESGVFEIVLDASEFAGAVLPFGVSLRLANRVERQILSGLLLRP